MVEEALERGPPRGEPRLGCYPDAGRAVRWSPDHLAGIRNLFLCRNDYFPCMSADGSKHALFLLVGSVLAVSCATTTNYRLTPSSAVRGTRGTVEVSAGDHEDNRLSIQVDSLAGPSQLTPGASAYVVWVTPTDGAAAQNVGALQIDGRSGSLSTTTPLNDFIVSITPEIEAQAIAPSGPQVLSVTVDR